jgi:hypothetical protein
MTLGVTYRRDRPTPKYAYLYEIWSRSTIFFTFKTVGEPTTAKILPDISTCCKVREEQARFAAFVQMSS